MQLINWDNNSGNQASTKGFVYKIYKELKNFKKHKNKTNNNWLSVGLYISETYIRMSISFQI